ncbi:MAG: hypothetical protein ACJAVR_002648 [Paracoccaceae bacterium]|jgi:hypothetical protein
MRAHKIICALILALAGCGNAEPGLNDAIKLVVGEIGIAPAAPAAALPAYADLVALPYASIGLRLEGAPDAPIALLAANSFVNGRVWYVDMARRGVILEGGRVAGSRGMVQDLLGAQFSSDDPLTNRTAPQDWPSETLLIQRARDGVGEEYIRAYRCSVTYHGEESAELYQRSLPLAHFSESCSGGQVAFQNDHWVDPVDGRMWKTRQWTGPGTGFVDVVVIRAFGD